MGLIIWLDVSTQNNNNVCTWYNVWMYGRTLINHPQHYMIIGMIVRGFNVGKTILMLVKQ